MNISKVALYVFVVLKLEEDEQNNLKVLLVPHERGKNLWPTLTSWAGRVGVFFSITVEFLIYF